MGRLVVVDPALALAIEGVEAWVDHTSLEGERNKIATARVRDELLFAGKLNNMWFKSLTTDILLLMNKFACSFIAEMEKEPLNEDTFCQFSEYV